jgi:toxin ParE1/3/4
LSGTRGSGGAPGRLWFSEYARLDLDAILTTGLEQFGETKALKYADGLSRVLSLLAVFPQMGVNLGHIRTGMRRHVHGSHAIYYRIHESGVRVLRILGPGQDPVREFFD